MLLIKMNTSNSQPVIDATPNFIDLTEVSVPKELDDLKVLELRLLLILSKVKIGEWMPLAALRGSQKQTSSFSRSIAKFTEAKWISTKKDPDDGRGKQVRLTTKGRHRLKPLVSKSKTTALLEVEETIPQTTRRHYLTAKTALNIPSTEGTGDWHFFEMFQGTHGRKPGPFFVSGVNVADTYDIFNDMGIDDYSELLRRVGIDVKLPVFAADHYRAMADLIYQRLQDDKGLQSYRAEDWFPAVSDRKKLRDVLNKLKPHLESAQINKLTSWMKEQSIG